MTLKPYVKKNGDLMFYINDYAKRVSVGFGDTILKTKLTAGQKKLLDKFFEKMHHLEPIIKDFTEKEAHKEPCKKLDFGVKMYITDIGRVAGNQVQADGMYIEYVGNLYNSNQFACD